MRQYGGDELEANKVVSGLMVEVRYDTVSTSNGPRERPVSASSSLHAFDTSGRPGIDAEYGDVSVSWYLEPAHIWQLRALRAH